MGATPTELDAIIDEHFMFEATDNIDGVVASLAQEVEHEVIPSPMGVSTDKSRIRSFYQMLFAGLEGESAADMVATDGDLSTVRWGVGPAVTVALSPPVTGVLCGSVALADAVLAIEPESMSAWVAW